jgi:hypothetical protein
MIHAARYKLAGLLMWLAMCAIPDDMVFLMAPKRHVAPLLKD